MGRGLGLVLALAATLLVPADANLLTDLYYSLTSHDICGGTCHCPAQPGGVQHPTIDCRDSNITQLQEYLEVPETYYGVDFSRNLIQEVTADTFDASAALHSLDFSDNRVSRLPPQLFRGLSHLYVLVLKNNNISEVHEQAFARMANLTQLDLSYNQISSLPGDVLRGLDRLEELRLCFNPLRSPLNAALFGHTPALRRLDISSLGLTSLDPELLHNLTRLEVLVAAYNQLTVVPGEALFTRRASLISLDLSANPIKSLGPYAFAGLTNLRQLKMEQMLKLDTIDGFAFGDLTHLETVELRYLPHVYSVDPKAFYNGADNGTSHPIIVEDFTFSFSMLTTLPEHLLLWDRLRFVSLEFNHWTCDCRMKWVKSSPLMDMVGSRMVCSKPNHLRGRRLQQLREEELTCDPEPYSQPATLGFVSVLMIAGISASLATVTLLVYWRRGWVCRRPPHTHYHNIQRGGSTITITEDIDAGTSEA